jgi:cytochrome c oxidase subunit 2
MRIRAYTVTPENFDRWVAGQKAPAFTAAAPAAAPAAKGMASMGSPGIAAGLLADQAPQSAAATSAPQDTAARTAAVEPWFFPRENLPSHVVPKTPFPKNLTFDDALLPGGDVARGEAVFNGKGACRSCHVMTVAPYMMTLAGPNLAHVASRHTIASGLYPNDAPSLARWIKNAVKMKPGALMQVIGAGEIDPKTKQPTKFGALTDAEIADVVAYLARLK